MQRLLSDNVSLEEIYLDFVTWGLIPPDLDSLKQFFQQPTWLTIKLWNHYHRQQAKLLNQQSIATAKLTTCIVNIANSFGKENRTVEVDEFTLYRFSAFDDEGITQEAVDILEQCNKKGILTDYVMSAFVANEKILEAIKEKSKK